MPCNEGGGSYVVGASSGIEENSETGRTRRRRKNGHRGGYGWR